MPPLEQCWNTNNLSFVLFYTLEILDCSSPDFNIKKLEDDRCKEPRRRHSLSSEVKRQYGLPSTLDEHIYDDLIDKEETKTKSQISFLDSLQPGNSNSTIPVSQSHPFSYCNVPNMSRMNPDHVDSTVIESSSDKNADAVLSTNNTERRGSMVGGSKPSGQRSCLDSLQPENIPVSQSHPFFFCNVPSMSKKNPDHVDSTVIESAFCKNTDVVPSTKKTERRGGMVGVVKPSGYKVKLQDAVRPPDIKIVKPVNSSSDIDSLLIQDLAEYLHILNIGQYAEQFADAQIDGILLKELDEQILIEEFRFNRFEAIKLMKFARHGHLPKPSE